MTKEFMTICLVSQEYPPETGGGGIGTQTFLKAHGLAALGHTVHVISSTYDGLDRTEPDGPVVVHRLRHPACDTEIAEPSAHWVAYSWAVAKKIYELLEEVRFDLIEFPEYGAEGFIYQIDAYSYHRIPIVVMLHGSLAMFSAKAGWPEADTDFYRLGTLMEDTVVRRADLRLAASHNIARFWAERSRIPLGEIAVVHLATDATRFSLASASANDRPTVLFVGRVDDEKGVFDVAEAVLRLREKYPDILFRIVGAGDEESTDLLRQKIEGSGAQRNFELVGYVPLHELAPCYAACDVFASPAPNEHGLAGVNLEAMACGKPVVASTQGGASEAVVDGQTGLLVPPGDLDALVRALDRLLGHPDLRDQLGQNGRRRVLDYFSVEKHVARVEAIYRRRIANFKA